jgi:antimicrobial peptide system SdpA family protein
MLFMVASSSLGPTNPLSSQFLTTGQTLSFANVLPEGFAFFTKDPREQNPFLYEIQKNNGLIPITTPNSSPSNLFGLSRYQRALYVELGSIISLISSSDRTTCATSFSDCIAHDLIKTVKIQNRTPNALLCGSYYLKMIEPVPWAWHRTFKGEMPMTVVKLELICPDAYVKN